MSTQFISAQSLEVAKKVARRLGATHMGTDYYPPRRFRHGGWEEDKEPFSYHFFKGGDEIAMFIVSPDGVPLSGHVQVFDLPRVWGIPLPRTMESLS